MIWLISVSIRSSRLEKGYGALWSTHKAIQKGINIITKRRSWAMRPLKASCCMQWRSNQGQPEMISESSVDTLGSQEYRRYLVVVHGLLGPASCYSQHLWMWREIQSTVNQENMTQGMSYHPGSSSSYVVLSIHWLSFIILSNILIALANIWFYLYFEL